ncbi:unnamed protein product [Arabidopsis halleri]
MAVFSQVPAENGELNQVQADKAFSLDLMNQNLLQCRYEPKQFVVWSIMLSSIWALFYGFAERLYNSSSLLSCVFFFIQIAYLLKR